MAIRETLSTLPQTLAEGGRRIKASAANAGASVKESIDNAGQRIKHAIEAMGGPRSHPLTTDHVLAAEYKEIWGHGLPDEKPETYRDAVQRNGQAALCLSGGGIRSAAFSLGVLQVLARRRLLTQFNYLSTVSGGGYIGAWLSRWIADVPKQDATVVEEALAGRAEIGQVSSLRANSNFITPRIGIASIDTWTATLLWVRNVLLNWTVFVPALLIAVLVPNLYLSVMTWLAAPPRPLGADRLGQNLATALLCIATLSLTVATWQTVRGMPSHRSRASTGAVIGRRIVVPLLIWAALVPLVLVAGGYGAEQGGAELLGLPAILVWLLVASFGAKIAGYVLAAVTNRKTFALYVKNAFTWVLVAAIATGALGLAVWIIDLVALELLAKYVPSEDLAVSNVLEGKQPAVVFALSVLGPLGGTLAHLLLSTLYMGFRVVGVRDDDDREWLAGVSALCFFPALIWATFAAICLFLPLVFINNNWLLGRLGGWGTLLDGLAKALAVATGLLAVLGGKSPTLKLDLFDTEPKSKLTRSYEISVRLAALAFIAAVFTGLAYAERLAAEAVATTVWAPAAPDWQAAHILFAHAAIIAVLLIIVTVSSLKIDVNRFSMHGAYRNRLMRAFLGAARAGKERDADPFTGFDRADNCRVSELQAKKDGRRVLYPVINATLNLVGGENLAWQERKASSFIISPLYCGSAALGPPAAPGRERKTGAAGNPPAWRGAYVGTQSYGGSEPDERGKTGISLGTAMTISGAAASPNMGYHSSPETAFLMTLFNVRLGAWLANPAAKLRKRKVQGGATSALRPLLTEALGMTNARSANVYLSDGGHFDNLGIYEMIRRRCRYILVVDAGADEKFQFEDLARSVRFACIDLDARIDFEKTMTMKPARASTEDSAVFALGEITYAERPDPHDKSWLIYLKPTYWPEAAPIDVRSYGAVNRTFPHETTLDQWFGESQFESYRRLGEYLMENVCGALLSSGAAPALKLLFEAATKAEVEVGHMRLVA